MPIDDMTVQPSRIRQEPADFARCNGNIYSIGNDQELRFNLCPNRMNCIRFLSPPHRGTPRQAWIVIRGECTSQVPISDR